MIEPVAWQFRHKPTNASWNYCSKTDAAEFAAIGDYETRPLYAIPEGYKVVPVEPTEAMIDAGGHALGNYIKSRIADGTAGAMTQTHLGYYVDWKTKMRLRYKAMIEGEQ